MTGRVPPESINPVEFPESMGQVWMWFLALSGKRPQAMAGLSPITEAEIGWYFRNRGIVPEYWVFDALGALDRAAIESAGESVK